MVRTRNLIRPFVCLSVAQSGTYAWCSAGGRPRGVSPPVFGSPPVKPSNVPTDPLVQALTLTDIVVSATVTALLLAIAVQVHKRHGTVDPNELVALEG